jgi:probable F420-dependent oxidoreductase
MKVYAGMDPTMALTDVSRFAARIEDLGYDGLLVPETIHDSLSVSLLALEHTTRLEVVTAVTLAFVRSPTLLAYQAWDLAAFSGGRFALGLGTQVRQHVEGRHAMAFSPPLPRLADIVTAIRALFESFATGTPVEHHGPFVDLSRLPAYFNPGPLPGIAAPRLLLGAVGPRACELAGSVADGLVTHPTSSSPRYLDAVALPARHRGLESRGRSVTDVPLIVGTLVVTGADAAALEAERIRQRQLLAMLFSTPAYARTLELYDEAALGPRLRALIADNRSDELGQHLDDELFDALVPTGTIDEVVDRLLERYSAIADAVMLSVPPGAVTDTDLAHAVARLRRG